MCYKDWSTHGDATGGYYTCNTFEADGRAGKLVGEMGAAYTARETMRKREAAGQNLAYHETKTLTTIRWGPMTLIPGSIV